MNNLVDISLYHQYGNICGYTQADLETTFRPYMEGVDMEKVKCWYDGYNFLKDNVYNPFDILNFCATGHLYKNYWFETGSPSFLLKLIQEKNYYVPQLENVVVDEEQLGAFDIERINFEVLLYQSGYLTIDRVFNVGSRTMYELKIPNLEVKASFSDKIFNMLTDAFQGGISIQNNAYIALTNGDRDGVKDALYALFASLPYQNYVNNNIFDKEARNISNFVWEAF